MPAFYLTPTQRRAMDALSWLYAPGQGERRTGRSRVLALNYLRRLAIGGGAGRDGWMDVEDHHAGDEINRMMAVTIQGLAREIGMYVEIARGPRVRLVSPVSRHVVEALTEFGEIPDDSLGIDESMLEAFAVHGRRRAPHHAPQPSRSLWEQLREDD